MTRRERQEMRWVDALDELAAADPRRLGAAICARIATGTEQRTLAARIRDLSAYLHELAREVDRCAAPETPVPDAL